MAAARVRDPRSDESGDPQHQEIERAGRQLGDDEDEASDQPDEVGIHWRPRNVIRGYATSIAGQGAFGSFAQAGSISACSTSLVERFWTNAATPRFLGFAPGRSGRARLSSSFPPSPNASGPIHSRTTKSCWRRLPSFSPAFTSLASRFSYAAR